MASHQIAIAKASFSAGLLRPDPTSVPRDEITAFHTLLERVLSHCSTENIQTCKAWLLRYVAASSNRVGGLAKFLVALATSFEPQPAQHTTPKRRRLHILYLLNDLFHHCKYHLGATATFSTVSGSLQPHIVDLVGHAAACDRQKYPRHHQRLDDLLDIWSEHGYFNSELVGKLREVIINSATLGAPPSTDGAGEADQAKKPGKDVPFVMPSTHGDSSTPFYDLPAGNLIPHIIPNSSIPLRPDGIKPLHLQAGPADGTLVKALKGFLCQVDKIYGTDDLIKDDGDADIDELGQSVLRDEITGDILEGETYYGWSRAFCQQMKRGEPEDSRSRSRSRSGTRTNIKRRRYSDSRSESRTPSRSRSRSVRRRFDSRERSRSPRRSRSRESSYTPHEPSPSHFPPPHQPHQPQQPQHHTAPMSSFPLHIIQVDMVNMPTHPWVLIAALFPRPRRTTVPGLHLPHTCRPCPMPHLVPELLPQPSLLRSMLLPRICHQDRVSLYHLVIIISLHLIRVVSTVTHGVLLPKVDGVGAECGTITMYQETDE
ncbi:uncharacterized protein N7446_009148 [Penicillium canescens]|uniref:CID domain-containing protein n=1 Tax=Penicillium canescens TaxID=5083 RepID=A0AAD6I601_PENCN|nr:uncharacterized protein N7446_009148 [Penicillium canescens]KAJ6034399.1 hypothetical protein N7460_008574 [Penicillium canescens]KAJ6046059.1 hypothetical protein N7444_007313 [Penicillium canescens]KAJ6053136.1 hypothetical protein N7446_009148 [Penicillium canescens]